MYAFFYLYFCSLHVHESLYNVNVKIPVSQIIGPAVAGSAGPVPTPVNKQHMTDWYMIEFNDYSSLSCRRLDLLLFKVMLGYG